MSAELRSTRCYVAWDANRKGRLFRLCSNAIIRPNRPQRPSGALPSFHANAHLQLRLVDLILKRALDELARAKSCDEVSKENEVARFVRKLQRVTANQTSFFLLGWLGHTPSSATTERSCAKIWERQQAARPVRDYCSSIDQSRPTHHQSRRRLLRHRIRGRLRPRHRAHPIHCAEARRTARGPHRAPFHAQRFLARMRLVRPTLASHARRRSPSDDGRSRIRITHHRGGHPLTHRLRPLAHGLPRQPHHPARPYRALRTNRLCADAAAPSRTLSPLNIQSPEDDPPSLHPQLRAHRRNRRSAFRNRGFRRRAIASPSQRASSRMLPRDRTEESNHLVGAPRDIMATEVDQLTREVAIEENEGKQVGIPGASQAIQSCQQPSRPVARREL